MIRIGSVGTEPEPCSQWTWPDLPRPRSSADSTLSASPVSGQDHSYWARSRAEADLSQ